MSVKRYDIEAYSYFEAASWTLVESEIGDFMYASDYDELRERVAWMMECDLVRKCIAFGTIPYNKHSMAEIMGTSRCAHKAVEELL